MSDATFAKMEALPPKRTAEEHFAVAGSDSCAVSVLPGGLVLVGGKGGDCLMTAPEWDRYRLLARRWFETPRDQAGVQVRGLRVPWHVTLDAARAAAVQVRDLIRAAQQTLSVEDYGDALEGARRRQGDLLQQLQALEEEIQRSLEGGQA